ncbi:MAG: SLBB domain-containing protein [Candidatus Eisenbacteria bacterium]
MIPSAKCHALRGALLPALLGLLVLAAYAWAAPEPPDAAEASEPPQTSPGTALSGPVDETLYVVGPGDRITVTVWGTAVRTFTVTVSPEGELFVPGMAGVDVAGLRLRAAKELLRDRLREVYHDVELSVALSGLRRVQVNVLGAVKEPGVYEAAIMTPASTLVDRAGGLTWGASRRNIRITRQDGVVDRLDLDRYRNAGDVTADPPILGGDVIFVPQATDFVYAQGAVARPGEYEHVEGEGIASLIEVAGGLARDAFPDTVELRRFVDSATTEHAMVPLSTGSETSVALAPGDQVHVRARPDWREAEWVEVEGEVAHPGTYGINEGVDRVSDVLARAGGPTDRAYVPNARVLRIVEPRSRDLELTRLLEVPVGSMTDTEYAYYKMRLREQGRSVSIDFEALLSGDSSQNALLAHGDVITIPEMSRTVTVSGQVGRPGKIAYEPGRRSGFYVSSAGGYSEGAARNRVRVIKASTGQWLSAKRAGVVRPGDEVWVPERPETDWWATVRDVLSFVTSLATVYLVIDQATSK